MVVFSIDDSVKELLQEVAWRLRHEEMHNVVEACIGRSQVVIYNELADRCEKAANDLEV